MARGDVFTVPIENGPVRNLTRSSSAHDKWARWSPDGRRIAFVSDASGEDEIYLVAQDGSGEPEQLTSGGQGMRYAAEWSPAGTHLASSDKDGRLIVVDVETREVIEVADEPRGPLRDYTWSPNGGYLAFSMTDPTDFSSIYVWSLAERRLHRITDESTSMNGTRRGIRTVSSSTTFPTGSSHRNSDRSNGTTWSTARPASTRWRCGRTWAIRCRRRATRSSWPTPGTMTRTARRRPRKAETRRRATTRRRANPSSSTSTGSPSAWRAFP